MLRAGDIFQYGIQRLYDTNGCEWSNIYEFVWLLRSFDIISLQTEKYFCKLEEQTKKKTITVDMAIKKLFCAMCEDENIKNFLVLMSNEPEIMISELNGMDLDFDMHEPYYYDKVIIRGEIFENCPNNEDISLLEKDGSTYKCIIELMKKNIEKYYTNHTDMLIVQFNNNTPIWIWTPNDITMYGINEIFEILVYNFRPIENKSFIVKSNIANAMVYIEKNYEFVEIDNCFSKYGIELYDTLRLISIRENMGFCEHNKILRSKNM
ncbi:MAG: hypothetical protein ACI4GW_09210 [Lachnospiraceae bacterium]